MAQGNSGKEQSHTVILMPSGRRDQVPEGKSLLEAADAMGVQIESICGGKQTCGKCHVIVEEGLFEKHKIDSRADHLSPKEDEEKRLLKKMDLDGQRLACAAYPLGDLLITVPEESRAQKQIIRKSATERVINVNPAVRQYYLEVDQAQLGEHRGDWGRVQDALAEGFQLEDLTIDLYALQRLQPVLREDDWRITATVWNGSAVIDVQPGYQEGVYGLAVDVGSTTVASYLSDLRTGELLATESLMNPQVSFGEDLMSRVSYSLNHRDGLKKMNAAIIKTINQLAAAAARQAGIRARNIQEITLVGNTTMTHILLNVPPDQLGSSPFALANRDAMDLRASELGLKLHPGARAHILPAQAGHVGADNVAVLIAEQPYLDEEVILTIDVGTNAEIVLTHGSTMYSASSPTGPAFEGGQISSGMRAAPGAIERVRIDPETKMPRFRVIGEEDWSDAWKVGPGVPLEDQPKHLAAGICGSGIIEAVAELFSAGLITSSGRFDPRVDCDRVLWEEDSRTGSYILAEADKTASGKPLLITQLDIRNIQLAKAALYAGAKLLMKRAEVEKVDKVILAGAFGSYINPEHALMLGLFPDCSLESIHSVGNAAGDGARIALLDRERRQEAQRIAKKVRYIETAVDSDFQDQFVGAMHIPHQEDKFEHLAGLLPESSTPLRRKRRFKRPRMGQ